MTLTMTGLWLDLANRTKLSTILQLTLMFSIYNFRFLVASRNLEPGEVIITAEPIVVGPYTGCDLICLGCYHPIIGNPFKWINNSYLLASMFAAVYLLPLNIFHRCKDCSWPLCGDECIGFHQPLGHSIEECSILKKHTKLDYTDLNEVKDLYQTIVPIR